MHELPLRRMGLVLLAIVILFTIVASLWHQWAMIRGVWLALIWQGASGACLALCARLLRPPLTQRRAWQLAGMACVKFPMLYALGYAALRWCAPSAVGLVMGLTLPWAVLVTCAMLSPIPSASITPSAIHS